MTNNEFLKKFQRLQLGIVYDKLIDLDFATVSYSAFDTSYYWNYALTDKILQDLELAEIERILISFNRQITIYFEHKKEYYPLEVFLKQKAYEQKFEDSWMFYEGNAIESAHFDSIKKVSNTESLAIYLQTFNDCYKKDDPQNPYGEIGGYLEAAKNSWIANQENGKLEYFIAYKHDQPVAVSALTSFEGIGYIANVGSIPSVRGEGYGKAVTLYCVKKSQEYGNTYHCLATEEGTYPNTFYKNIGFTTKFTTVGYSKENK